MIHDLLDESPFTTHSRGHALLQVSQQVRAEFWRIYTQNTTIGVHIENPEVYVEGWLQGPSPTGTIILGFNDVDRDFGPRLTPGTLTESSGTITVDIMPLVKLRRQNPNFQFYFVCKDNTTAVIPKAEEQNIDDSIDKIEASTRKWNIQPLVFRLKPEFKRTVYVEQQHVKPLENGPLEDWLGKIWGRDDFLREERFDYPGYDAVEAE
jgi:hypothetical protein